MKPQAILDHTDSARPWPPRENDAAPTDVAAAYQSALAVRALRIARGEKPVGYKIGFANRTGQGSNVLDGPLNALRHFVLELQQCPGAPGLRAGDVVTTGTWTDAWPVQAGQRWRSDFDAPLRGLQIEFL